MPQADAPQVGAPEWWLLRLLRRLQGRVPELSRWDDYYRGVQPLAFASSKFREAFGERFPVFSSNFCALVVDGTADRLEVQGFRFGDEQGDQDVWALWQANDMDAGSQLAHTDALIFGAAYALVQPDADGPIITVESALDTIVERDPRRRRVRRAALKRWIDDEGHMVLYLYTPDFVYKYRSERVWLDAWSRWWVDDPMSSAISDADISWRLWTTAGIAPLVVPDEEWPLPNPLGVVPIIELPNRPRLRPDPTIGYVGQSEIAPIRSNQDAVNKYRCDALIASEFAAFPQRYLLNYEPAVDPETGRSIEPFRSAIDRLWTVPPPDPDDPNPAQPSFGQFAAASLDPYQKMISMEVGHISAISRLPYHYLLGSPTVVPPSGESLKSSEAGLVRKIGRAELFLGEGWEEVMRVALLARQDARASLTSAETIWADSETRQEAVRTDSTVKLHAEGIIDDELAWEMIGLSPEQIRRLEARLAAAPPEPAPEAGGTPPTITPAPTGPRMGSPAPGVEVGA